jgi:dCTP deaminase
VNQPTAPGTVSSAGSGAAILTDSEILVRLCDAGLDRLVVSPLLNLDKQLGPSSLDVRLGPDFRIFQRRRIPYLNPFLPEETIRNQVNEYSEAVEVFCDPARGGFVLHPGEFALGATLEFVRLPDDIGARIEGRSSWGRLGLQIHATAGFIDPGFRGRITFELANIGDLPIPLYVGLRVAQLAFFRGTPALRPYGAERKYHFSMGAVSSQFYRDPEIDQYRRLLQNRSIKRLEKRLSNSISAAISRTENGQVDAQFLRKLAQDLYRMANASSAGTDNAL